MHVRPVKHPLDVHELAIRLARRNTVDVIEWRRAHRADLRSVLRKWPKVLTGLHFFPPRVARLWRTDIREVTACSCATPGTQAHGVTRSRATRCCPASCWARRW